MVTSFRGDIHREKGDLMSQSKRECLFFYEEFQFWGMNLKGYKRKINGDDMME